MSLKTISGFSKMDKDEKIQWISQQFEHQDHFQKLKNYWHKDAREQKVFDEFSENTISNYYMPYSLAPNLFVNGKLYHAPMVIEESSVVAAASAGAKFWLTRGGIQAEVVETTKWGQIHFLWQGETVKLEQALTQMEPLLQEDVAHLTHKMQQRGGGIKAMKLLDYTNEEENYYQLELSFETCDAMGANFINTVLEAWSKAMMLRLAQLPSFTSEEKKIDLLMCILTNYNKQCLVKVSVDCLVKDLEEFPYPDSLHQEPMSSEEFAKRFAQAIRITHFDTKRAVTSNKGIFNGIDAVALATGNDFRAIEAAGHAYAARKGQYRGLSWAEIKEGHFHFGLELPLSVGTVGGASSLHPLAQSSLELLGHPNAKQLMMIMASVGLVQHFTAIRALVTTGIQKGHMQLHLVNILNQLDASKSEMAQAKEYFSLNHTVSFSSVRDFLKQARQQH